MGRSEIVRMGEWGDVKCQILLVNLSTKPAPGVAILLVLGTVWELTAHSDGLMGFSPNGVEGEERGVPRGVTITEEVLGVGGREGVSGRDKSGEGVEEEVRGVGRGRGGGGGGLVRASMSPPCRGKERGGHESTGTC